MVSMAVLWFFLSAFLTFVVLYVWRHW